MCRIYKKPVLDLEATGKRIKTLRVSSMLSVKQIQSVFNFEHPQAVYNWESGKSLPSVDNLLVLADLFGVRMDEIVVYRTVEVECDLDARKSA